MPKITKMCLHLLMLKKPWPLIFPDTVYIYMHVTTKHYQRVSQLQFLGGKETFWWGQQAKNNLGTVAYVTMLVVK